jgi:hypothetical protein
MKGDFSRWSFRPKQHYHGVLKQQGRVDLDSDWNEQGAIVAHLLETEALDVIGVSGAPENDAGFLIKATSDGKNLVISTGRAYVDGILCENEQANLLITAQPDLPGFQLPTAAGMYLAYLQVWERHITYLDDSKIREVALGGPDTCTRARTTWQVKLQQAGAVGSGITCSTDVQAYDNLIVPSTGKLQAQAVPSATTDPCMVPSSAGYRSLENQLYRVEIHNAGTGDATVGNSTATFKWSRDNGSVVATWIAPPSGQPPVPNTVFVSSTGKDSVLGFAAGQWIELSDDTRELNFQAGTLVRITSVQGQVLTVDPSTVIPTGGSLNLADYPLNPKVRGWDALGLTPTTTGSWLDLENGVQVQFASGTYANGDYWLIPARTLTANIDWPLDGSGNPVAEPPKGIHKHYCRLAVVQFDGSKWSSLLACLPIFPPLSSLDPTAIHVNDVRILSPDQELLNDSEVSMTQVANEFGINTILDTAVDPVSAQPTTCFVTVDLPYPLKDVVAVLIGNNAAEAAKDLHSVINRAVLTTGSGGGLNKLPVLGFQPLILPGKVTATATTTGTSTTNQISWTPSDKQVTEFLAILLEVMPALQPTSRLLTHLTLKGDYIWGLADPTKHLDGNVFGIKETSGTATSIGLQYPSGDGIRGGDFEMWFYLVQPLIVAGVQFSPNPVGVTAGATTSATGSLALIGTQLTAGNTVKLTSQALDSNGKPITANVGTVPSSVTLGTDSSPRFPVTGITLPAGMPSAQLQVTATYGSQPPVSGTLTINAQTTLTKIAFLNAAGAPVTSVPGGTTVTFVLTLSGPAPAGGAVVKLTATVGTPPAATIPASVTIPAGSSTFQVSVPTVPRTSPITVNVTGTFGASVSASLTITAG